MIHAVIALVVQAILWLAFGSPLYGCLLMSGAYIMREITQAEYRAIAGFYGGKRENAPWWCGGEPRAWNLKSILDWALPTACVSLVVALALSWGPLVALWRLLHA